MEKEKKASYACAMFRVKSIGEAYVGENVREVLYRFYTRKTFCPHWLIKESKPSDQCKAEVRGRGRAGVWGKVAMENRY